MKQEQSNEQQNPESQPLPNYWGTTPEEEYYTQQGIKSTKSFYTSPRGQTLFTRSWHPTLSPPRGIICMVHGYGNDISWTFQATPIFLAQNGFSCFALDLPGHGQSQGLKGFVPNVDLVVDDCISYFSSVKDLGEFKKLPSFLHGESMGGAICLLIHFKNPNLFNGAVLISPMCKISDKVRPRWPIPEILTLLGKFMPTLPIVPSLWYRKVLDSIPATALHIPRFASHTMTQGRVRCGPVGVAGNQPFLDKSIKVERKKEIAVMNPLRYGGKPRLGTVMELIRVTDYLSGKLCDVVIPFIVLHGSADLVTDPNVSRALYEEAKSEDKTIKIYEGMLHSLLFGETDENIELVRSDIVAWLSDRCKGGSKFIEK